MSCDNCDCMKCKKSRQESVIREAVAHKQPRAQPSTTNIMDLSRETCQCGAPKYWDAVCCDRCWDRGSGYPDR